MIAMAGVTGQIADMKHADFASKFTLVLRALNISRGNVAAGMGVDKSLVGRWASGVVTPSDYNLARLSSFIAEKRPGFSMADWARELNDLAKWFGVPLVAESEHGYMPGFPPSFISHALELTRNRGLAYEGFWRTSRPSVLMPGAIFRDHGMIRIDANGYLAVRMGGAGMTFEGVILPGENNLFAVFYSSVSAAPYFLIAKGVHLPRADMLEGLLLLSALDAAQTPAAVPIVLERIGDLSNDMEQDDLHCSELIDSPPVAREGEVSEEILTRLIRDVGPAAEQNGGERFLMTAFAALSRGSTKSGDLRG
jgi:transcriptional regulator with XRE-family HTH domain